MKVSRMQGMNYTQELTRKHQQWKTSSNARRGSASLRGEPTTAYAIVEVTWTRKWAIKAIEGCNIGLSLVETCFRWTKNVDDEVEVSCWSK